MPGRVLLFGVFMLGMALGALLTRIQLKGMLAKVIREELEKEHSGRERDDGQTKSDAA